MFKLSESRFAHAASFAALVAFALQASSCSTSRAHLRYDEFDKEVAVHSDKVEGKELGHVRGNDGGAIWNDCSSKAADSLRDLIDEARNLGANAVGDLKWFASGTSEPSCKKGWGYFLIWPFVLTPLFMSTEVEGTAYKIAGAPARHNHANLILLPNTRSEEEALIQRVVAGH